MKTNTERMIESDPETLGAAWKDAFESVRADSYPAGYDVLDDHCKGQPKREFDALLAAAKGDIRLALADRAHPELGVEYNKSLIDPIIASFVKTATDSLFRAKAIKSAIKMMRKATDEGKKETEITKIGLDEAGRCRAHIDDLAEVFEDAARRLIERHKAGAEKQRQEAAFSYDYAMDRARSILHDSIETSGTRDLDTGELSGASLPVGLVDDLIKGNPYPSFREAASAAAERGVKILDRNLYPLDLYESLIHLGFKAHYDELLGCYMISHPMLDRERDWAKVIPSKDGFQPLLRARNAIFQGCAHIEAEKSTDGDAYKIEKLPPGAWGSADSLYQAFASLKGREMSVKNDLVDFADQALSTLASMEQEQRDALVASLQAVFTAIPGIAPTTDSFELAKHCGIYVYTMIGHRILQHHPAYKPGGPLGRSYRPCRETMVVCGQPGIGKSTICEHIVDAEQNKGMETGKLQFGGDALRMASGCVGKLLMVINDLEQVGQNKKTMGAIKAFLTEPTIAINPKYRDPGVIPMPCIFMATANNLEIPSDDGLEIRFVPVEFVNVPVVIPEDWPSEWAEDGRTPTEHFFNLYRPGFLLGGIQSALNNKRLEASPELIKAKRKIFARLERADDDIVKVVERLVSEGWLDIDGRPFLPVEVVVWKAGWLEYPYDIEGTSKRKGDVIEPEENLVSDSNQGGVGFKVLRSAWTKMTKDGARGSRMIRRIRVAFDRQGWTDQEATNDDVRGKIEGHSHALKGFRPRIDVGFDV